MKQLFKTAMSLKRVALNSRYRVSMPKVKLNNFPCLIFGNGPSLDGDIREKIGMVQKCETFCVGRFAESDLYVQVKPKYYVLTDTMWWASSAPEITVSMRDKLYRQIINETTWPLNVCAPFEAKEFLSGIFKNSPNIRLLHYNNVPLWGEERVLNRLYDLNLGMPPAQNVLVTSLFLALRMGYKKIIVLGADHSWHETLALDDLNRVCLRDRHFYDKDVSMRPFTMDGSDGKIFTMDTLFHALARMFEGYWKIARYAVTQQAMIINASSVTYVDAFKRKSFSEAIAEFWNK